MRVLTALIVFTSACATTAGVEIDRADGREGSSGDVLDHQPELPDAAAFHTAQGKNGRHCGTCHLPESGWSIGPADIEQLFLETDGTDPLFNRLDADDPKADLSTPSRRYAAFSMLRRGLYRKNVAVPRGAEFEVIGASDPRGAGSTERLVFFRRPLPTANLKLSTGTMWDDKMSVPAAGGNIEWSLRSLPRPSAGAQRRAGLLNQARVVILGVEEGAAPAATTVDAIVDDELHLWSAVESWKGIALDGCGARGGVKHLMTQPLISGPWTLFDAWTDLEPGACSTQSGGAQRARIAHGQQVFNQKKSATGDRCVGCHNVVNNGTNINGILFDIGASSALRRTPDMPIYRLRHKVTGALRDTTDPGKALVTGRWSDVDRFKVPTLRGVSLRAPYFHNGTAASLAEVLHHYEETFGFDFTDDERQDLLAFLEAL